MIVEARVKKILGEFALFQVLTSINQEWQGQSNRVGEANHNYERLIHWNSKTSENDTDHWRMSINHCRLHDKTAHLTMYSGEGKKKLMLHFHCQRQPAWWGHWRLMVQYDLQRLHGIPKIYMLQTGCLFLSRELETLSVSVCSCELQPYRSYFVKCNSMNQHVLLFCCCSDGRAHQSNSNSRRRLPTKRHRS